MTARIIDGVALSQRIREEVAQRVAALAAQTPAPAWPWCWWAKIPPPRCMCATRSPPAKGRPAFRERAVPGGHDRGRSAGPHRHAEPRSGHPRHPGAAAAAQAHGRAQGHRGHRRRKGRGRFPRQQRRPAHDRPAAVPPLHALRRDEDAGIRRRGPARRRGRHRGRQQHRRQAHGHAAAAGGRHHHDLQLQDPRPGRADAAPTCWSWRPASRA